MLFIALYMSPRIFKLAFFKSFKQEILATFFVNHYCIWQHGSIPDCPWEFSFRYQFGIFRFIFDRLDLAWRGFKKLSARAVYCCFGRFSLRCEKCFVSLTSEITANWNAFKTDKKKKNSNEFPPFVWFQWRTGIPPKIINDHLNVMHLKFFLLYPVSRWTKPAQVKKAASSEMSWQKNAKIDPNHYNKKKMCGLVSFFATTILNLRVKKTT